MDRKTKRSKGFTLAELLIVVAIIGVLVAVSVPVFAGKIEKSREATDLANVRAAYAIVKTAVISGDAGDDVTIDSKGVYYVSVPLVQKEEDWQTPSGKLNIGGIGKSDEKHWREIPKAKGICKVTCNADGETVLYWNNGYGYKPVVVDDSAKRYEPALNAVLSTIYNSIVSDRLENDTMHISWVLFNNGKVTQVSCYSNKADWEKNGNKGQAGLSLTQTELDDLNGKIQKSLVGKDYKLNGAGAERVFFDWDGNVATNTGAYGNDKGIGGQGACTSLGLVPTDGGKKISLANKTGVWTAN